MVTGHGFVVLQPPPVHPEKTDGGIDVAVRFGVAPHERDVEQVAPQFIPPRSLVTVPEPVPALATVNE
jgi:hypothetical protein